jgi:hypothetical protein
MAPVVPAGRYEEPPPPPPHETKNKIEARTQRIFDLNPIFIEISPFFWF